MGARFRRGGEAVVEVAQSQRHRWRAEVRAHVGAGRGGGGAQRPEREARGSCPRGDRASMVGAGPWRGPAPRRLPTVLAVSGSRTRGDVVFLRLVLTGGFGARGAGARVED